MKQISVKNNNVLKPKNRVSTGPKTKLPTKLMGQNGMPHDTKIKKEYIEMTNWM